MFRRSPRYSYRLCAFTFPRSVSAARAREGCIMIWSIERLPGSYPYHLAFPPPTLETHHQIIMKDVFFSMAVLLGAVMVSKALPLNRRQATTTTAAPLPGSTSGASGNVATVFSVWGPVANTTAGGNPSAPSLLPEETFYIPGGSSTGLGGSNTTIYGYLMETFTSDASDVAQTVTITGLPG